MPLPNTTISRLRRPREFGKKMYIGASLGNKGYPGLANTASLIAEYIPKCKIFVEPFAGLGRISKLVHAETKILNDKSEYANKHNKKFKAIIENLDFMECIKKYDTENAVLFLDPPWRKDVYEVNDKCFIDREPYDYYKEFFDYLPQLKSKLWFICSDVAEKETKRILSKSGFFNKIFLSKRQMLGGKIQTRVCSNRPFIRHNQENLTKYE